MNVMEKYDCSMVFCLAGKGKRFVEHGVDTPKYLLRVDNKYLIEKSIENLEINHNHFVLFICNKKHLKYETLFKDILDNLNINFEIFYIDDTNGQAETGFIASEILISRKDLKNKPIIFFNGDTILKSRSIDDYLGKLSSFDGLIDAFNSEDPSFSYIETKKDIVKNIVEKEVISNKATSGLYMFSSALVYYQEYLEGKFNEKDSETFISEIYAYLIKKGMLITYYMTKIRHETVILGTFDQYNSYLDEN